VARIAPDLFLSRPMTLRIEPFAVTTLSPGDERLWCLRDRVGGSVRLQLTAFRGWMSKRANRVPTPVFLLLILVDVLAPVNPHAQILQLVPSVHTDRGPQSFFNACFNVQQWPTLYRRTTYLGAVSWQLRPDRATNSTLARCFAQMNARDLQLSLGVAITSVVATGLEAYQEGWPDWQRYQTLGAPLTAFFIDEPITNSTRILGLSYATIVNETVNWIVLVRQNARLVNIKLILIEAYPHISASTIIDFINDVNNAASLRGVAGLDGLEIDHAWDGRQAWSGSDMGAMRAAAHNRRMEFSIIFYAAMPFQNPTNDCDFRARLNQQWDAYKAYGIDYYGFSPDIYDVQSWDQLPSVTVPESTSACTFMQGAKQWLDSIDVIPPVHFLRPRYCDGQFAATVGMLVGCEQPAVR
jgi:hypothetical protein